jgi:hypothetical protein
MLILPPTRPFHFSIDSLRWDTAKGNQVVVYEKSTNHSSFPWQLNSTTYGYSTNDYNPRFIAKALPMGTAVLVQGPASQSYELTTLPVVYWFISRSTWRL